MRRYNRVLMGTLVAALLLAVGAATATARRIEIDWKWIRAEAAALVLGVGAGEIICSVTMEGSFHEFIINKVSGALIGYITSARVQHPCSGGEAWFLNGIERIQLSLPWHIRYQSFEGFLPAITGITVQVQRLAFQTRGSLGQECLWQSTAEGPAVMRLTIEAGGKVRELNARPSLIPLKETISGGCATAINWTGAFNFAALGGTNTRIRVRLVA